MSDFAKAANRVKEALEKVREGAKAKLPRHKMMLLEDNVRSLSKEFNSKFQAEISKYLHRVKNKKAPFTQMPNVASTKQKAAEQ